MRRRLHATGARPPSDSRDAGHWTTRCSAETDPGRVGTTMSGSLRMLAGAVVVVGVIGLLVAAQRAGDDEPSVALQTPTGDDHGAHSSEAGLEPAPPLGSSVPADSPGTSAVSGSPPTRGVSGDEAERPDSPERPSQQPPSTRPPSPQPPSSTPAPGSPGPGTSPPPTAAPGGMRGTWVVHQVTSRDQLQRQRAMLDTALSTPGVAGFSMRVPWTSIDGGFELLDDGLAVARAHRLPFAVRFMAGRHTPAHVTAAGPSYDAGGTPVPTPFTSDGSPNTAFEAAYGDVVASVAEWARRSGVELLHLPWYGQDWAELNHGREVRAAPGYSYEAWLDAHRRLVDVAVGSAGDDVVLEWPLSGYGPLWPAAGDLANHLAEVFRGRLDRVVVQANGWDHDGIWGAPNQDVERQLDGALSAPLPLALQSIQPTAARWAETYALARERTVLYVEVYAETFSGPAADEVKREIRAGVV